MTTHTSISPDDRDAIKEQWQDDGYGCHGSVHFAWRCTNCGSYTTVDTIYVYRGNARKVRTLRYCESCTYTETEI